MPIKLNVGAARKISDEKYGSRGASVNLELELESALILDTAKLQERIRHLFGLVQQSLTEELNARRDGQVQPRASDKQPTVSNGHKQDGTTRLATPKQIKALYAIARQRGFDLKEVLRDRFNLERPEQFTLQQASDLITALKSGSDDAAA